MLPAFWRRSCPLQATPQVGLLACMRFSPFGIGLHSDSGLQCCALTAAGPSQERRDIAFSLSCLRLIDLARCVAQDLHAILKMRIARRKFHRVGANALN